MNQVTARTAARVAKTVIWVGFAIALVVPAWAQDSADNNDDQAEQNEGRRVVLVSLVDRQLAVIQDGEVIATFSVAVGADITPSPTGEFKVVSRVQNPTYYHPRTVIPAGKDNPLGTRWLGLSQKGYGIHGTNAPKSIGRAASHGCIRLHNRDVEKLFTMVRIGDMVKIRGARDEETSQIFGKPNDTLVAEASIATASVGQ